MKHFKIHQNEQEFYVDERETFGSLMDLVDHFKSYPLSISVERLGNACKRVSPDGRREHCEG